MPRMVELIRSSAVPSNLMQAAAKGALALPAEEMIEILVHLAKHNKVFGEQARLTLAGWDERPSREVASDPNSPREVLEYMIARENLRPALLAALLENPSVPDAPLIELASSGPREVVEAMLKSARVGRSPAMLQGMSSNPNLTGTEARTLREKLGIPEAAMPAPQPEASTVSDDILPSSGLEEPSGSDEVIDQAIIAYLAEHAGEIAADENKPFQPIGGFYDEFVPGSNPAPAAEVAPAVAPAVAPPAPAAAAAPKKAAVAKKSHLSHEEERGSALQKISRLDVKGRIQLAMKGSKEERSILIRDGTKLVAISVLESPKISDGEVEKYAAQKNVLEAVLRAIPLKRRFAKHYGIVRSLVFNPRTPLDLSLGLMKHILARDLKVLSGNKEVSDTVRKLALKMFKQKMDVSKKE